jgi:predicted NBD/HSP70 family sugar kinase
MSLDEQPKGAPAAPPTSDRDPADGRPLAGALRPRGSNHVGMRQFNERVILQALRLHRSLPKADLARLTGLTAQTIGLITTRLEEDGLVLRQDRLRGRIGQPSIPLCLNPDGAFSIGIKIGRRAAEWLLVDFTGAIRERRTLSYEFPDLPVLLNATRNHLHSLITSDERVLAARLVGVGVAAPFQLGGWHRMLGLSRQRSDLWNDVRLGDEIQALTDLPVSFARDTLAACVSELVSGRGHELKSFLYLYVDTFVGGGVVLNSHLHPGLHGNAGAVASLPLQRAAGGQAPQQLLGEASLWELETVYREQGLDASAAYDDRAILDPAYSPYSLRWLKRAAAALAHAVTAGTAFIDMGDVVIDGSMSRLLLDALLKQTRMALDSCNWEGLWRPEIHAGNWGADASALGGALLPLHENFAPDHGVFLKA